MRRPVGAKRGMAGKGVLVMVMDRRGVEVVLVTGMVTEVVAVMVVNPRVMGMEGLLLQRPTLLSDGWRLGWLLRCSRLGIYEEHMTDK